MLDECLFDLTAYCYGSAVFNQAILVNAKGKVSILSVAGCVGWKKAIDNIFFL